MSATASTPFPNQPPPYADRNLYADDLALQEALAREGGAWAAECGARMGRDAWTPRRRSALGDAANRHPPELATHDARGERIDAVDVPSGVARAHAPRHRRRRPLQSLDRSSPGRAGRARRARPSACAGRKRHAMPADDDVRERPGAAPRRCRAAGARARLAAEDPRAAITIRATCRSAEKRAALIGMGMTERQGGSDVRSNRTRATAGVDGARAAHRPQMVLLRAAVRRAPRARAGGRRSLVLPAAADASPMERATPCGSTD